MNYKISGDSTTAVSMTEDWQPMMLCPREVKVQLLTKGRVAVYGTVTAETLKDYRGWAPVPKEPQWLKDQT